MLITYTNYDFHSNDLMRWISKFCVDRPWHVWSQEDTDTRKKKGREISTENTILRPKIWICLSL